jgi:transaldolase
MSKVKIYADGAVLSDMQEMYNSGLVQGFTTNPSLMKKAGIKNYQAFAKEVLTAITDLPISFEVFADTLAEMEQEAREIASWGKNVYVKIPIMTTKQISTIPLIKELSNANVSLNVTAIFTEQQVKDVVDAFALDTNNIVSVFAGRIADTGVDPLDIMKTAVKLCRAKSGTELLWASPREVLNIVQAEEIGCDIITCTPDIIKKYHDNLGKDLVQFSLETVQMFYNDSQSLGYKIIE